MASAHNSNILLIKNKPQMLLSQGYSGIMSNYQTMRINILLHSIPSHYLSKFRDLIIWNNPEENMKCYYQSSKSKRKIPMKAVYYKNYLKFFCRPFMWNLHFDHILQEYINQKAKTFYKQVYGTLNQPENERDDKDERDDMEGNASNRNLMKEKNEAMKTIFDSSARKVIDYNLVTTLDIDDNKDKENFIDLRRNADDFFTIGPRNDFLIDLLTNLTNTKKQKKVNYFGLNSRLLALSPMTTKFKDNKGKRKNDNHLSIILPEKHKIKSSYCNIYKQKNIQIEPKTKSNIKIDGLSNKSIRETRAFQLHSPKYQINSKYLEFKKYNSQSKSKSKSKGKMNSFKGKSSINITETQKPQYTFYNKSNWFKYSVDNKLMVKSPTNIKQRMTTSNKGKDDKKKKATSKSKLIFLSKDTVSPNISTNLLIGYLNNCSNSRQTKRKCENYLSVRNLSNEKTLPIQLNHNKKQKSINHSSTQTNLSNNSHIVNTAQNYNNKPDCKENKKKKQLSLMQYNKGLDYHFYKNETMKSNPSAINPSQIISPVNAHPFINGIICRNQSHLNLLSEKTKSNNTAEVEKLLKSIKKNLQLNKIGNNISSKNNKSTKHNDSSQTSSNTHQGHGHSKSPKLIDKARESTTTNSNMIIKYTTKSTKQSRRSSPGNYVAMYFSQRKC